MIYLHIGHTVRLKLIQIVHFNLCFMEANVNYYILSIKILNADKNWK